MGRSPLAGAQLNTQWRRKAHRAEWKWNQFEDSEAAAGVCAPFLPSPSINHRYPIKILHLVPVQNDTLTLSLSPETTTWIRRCRALKKTFDARQAVTKFLNFTRSRLRQQRETVARGPQAPYNFPAKVETRTGTKNGRRGFYGGKGRKKQRLIAPHRQVLGLVAESYREIHQKLA